LLWLVDEVVMDVEVHERHGFGYFSDFVVGFVVDNRA
jgi:hypothetical protein